MDAGGADKCCPGMGEHSLNEMETLKKKPSNQGVGNSYVKGKTI